MFQLFGLSFLFFLIKGILTQELYVGKTLGEFKSYHHQVGGEVFAVDESTFLIKKFTYDGNGKDTFFWAGSRPTPGPQGFLVPNEFGRTNLLQSYLNRDITITLPDGKRITDIKWLSVYDLSRLESFGDIFIPVGFEPPQKKILPSFRSRSERVSSGDIMVVDSKTLQINDFYFDGRGDTYFWVGLGPQPHSKGKKIPDEHGYMTPLQRYAGQDLIMTLPGEMDVFTTDWLALYDMSTKEVLGHLIIPEDLNVPPSLVTVTTKETQMPNCEQIHKNIQIGWEIFGDVITFEIAANMGQDDYVAFGMSGSESAPQMLGGDAAVIYRDTYNGYIKDYSLKAYFPCTEVIRGQKNGVCEDEAIKGQNNYQLLSSSRVDGISTFVYRRPLKTPDTEDIPIPRGPGMIIWALGPLDHLDTRPRPSMHEAWSKIPQPLDFERSPPTKNCFAFTHENKEQVSPWKTVHLTHPSQNLTFHLGPDGGPRGYSGITKRNSATGLAWYVDGFLVPEIYLRRDQTYNFYVYGGSNVYDPTNYHPLIITDESRGGFSQLKEEKKKRVRIFSGIETSVRGDVRPNRGGDTCKWEHPIDVDRRRDIDFHTFVDFRNSLSFSCGPDKTPGIVQLTPNRSWPDVLYYNSWTGENMGWKLHILDPERPTLT